MNGQPPCSKCLEYIERIKQLEEYQIADVKIPFSIISLLRGQEFLLLRHILSRQVVSAAQLQIVIYTNKTELPIERRHIDVLICRVRKKLKLLGLAIDNNRGVGYSISPANKIKIVTMYEKELRGLRHGRSWREHLTTPPISIS